MAGERVDETHGGSKSSYDQKHPPRDIGNDHRKCEVYEDSAKEKNEEGSARNESKRMEPSADHDLNCDSFRERKGSPHSGGQHSNHGSHRRESNVGLVVD